MSFFSSTRPIWFLLVALSIFLSVSLKASDSKSEFLQSTNSTNVLLLTAHPDDEVMFFSPVVHTMVANNVSFHVLCLSTGNVLLLSINEVAKD